MTSVAAVASALLTRPGFEAAFADLKASGDRGLYAELLSGTTWSPGREQGDHVYGSLQPGPVLSTRVYTTNPKGLPRGALDALLLFLLTHAEGPVAPLLREDITSLRLSHGDWPATDLGPLAALPNLRALGLSSVNPVGELPALHLDRLDLVTTPGLPQAWLEAVGPSVMRTNGGQVASTVVRLRLDGAPESVREVGGLHRLEELVVGWCTHLRVRDCPRLRTVHITGAYVTETLASWKGLPSLEELVLESCVAPIPRAPLELPPLPRLRVLVIPAWVDLVQLPESVERLDVRLARVESVERLLRPRELRIGAPGAPGPYPRLRDPSALLILDLSGRTIEDGDLLEVQRAPALQRLHVARTPLRSLRALERHPSLQVVDVSDCADLRDISALGTLPQLRVVIMAGACALTPADLPPDVQWTATLRPAPDLDALLARERPKPVGRRLPASLPPSAARLYAEVFPLMLRRDYDAIDVAIDAFSAEDIPAVWDWWLDGVTPERLCPRRMSQTLADATYARHAALRLVGAAPATNARAAGIRQVTTLRCPDKDTKGGRFDLSLLAGLPNLESAFITCTEVRVPDGPRPEWVPRLTSLHLDVWNPRDRFQRPDELVARVRAALPHVTNIVVG